MWHIANWGRGTSCTYLGGMSLRGVSSPHRYRQGMRGRTKAVILQLLKEYHRVELAFQVGYENGVQILRKQHSEDMTKVAADIFAHYYITGRNHLAIKLIVSACLSACYMHYMYMLHACYMHVTCICTVYICISLPPFTLPPSLPPSPPAPPPG